MSITSVSTIESLLGGVLIGVSGAIALLGSGQSISVSTICGGLLRPSVGGEWRASFLMGMAIAGFALAQLMPATYFEVSLPRPTLSLALAGLLVGFGTRLGGGCPAGHLIFGLARRSPRSLAAAATFVATGALTVFASHHIFGGGR
jgi:uncharacterized protein